MIRIDNTLQQNQQNEQTNKPTRHCCYKLQVITHQPRLTQVPPTSSPEKTAVFKFCALECNAAPCPPTPQPIIATSKSNSEASVDMRRKEVGLLCDEDIAVKAVEVGTRSARIAKRDKIAILDLMSNVQLVVKCKR